MPQQINAIRVNAWITCQQFPRRNRILDRLLLHGKGGIRRGGRDFFPVDIGSLIIANHGNALRRKVIERLHRANGFVPVAGAGALHQHHRRQRALRVFGQCEQAGKLPGRFPHLDCFLGYARGGSRFIRRGRRRGELQPSHFPGGVQAHGTQQIHSGHVQPLGQHQVFAHGGGFRVPVKSQEFPAYGRQLSP